MIKAVMFDFGGVMIDLSGLSGNEDVTAGLKDGRIRPFKKMFSLVCRLREDRFLTSVLSNTIPEHSSLIRTMGWYDDFDFVHLSHEMGIRKPEVKAYEIGIQWLGLRGCEILYVDDLSENLTPAQSLGMPTVLATSEGQVVRDICSIVYA
jgi:FMN phosphatase YigB (HAD superfamily)